MRCSHRYPAAVRLTRIAPRRPRWTAQTNNKAIVVTIPPETMLIAIYIKFVQNNLFCHRLRMQSFPHAMQHVTQTQGMQHVRRR